MLVEPCCDEDGFVSLRDFFNGLLARIIHEDAAQTR
ncbi:MAG: hypothetical protein ACI8QZ_001487, partial [Chlamydiales bacterium]